ncbi:MAG: hypothetical protein IKS00_03720 [Bacteroidales bacterium]|nr:hypothetical protein [Bacteroidales bacterium]
MTTYFWHQSEKASGENVLMKNLANIENTYEKSKVFNALLEMSSKTKFNPIIQKQIEIYNNKNGLKINPHLKYSKGNMLNKRIFIQSSFPPTDNYGIRQTDSDGRRMSFMFYIDSNNMDEACEQLKQYCTKIGKYYPQEELDALIKFANNINIIN